jgi:MFS family permease
MPRDGTKPARSLRALDMLAFFVADAQTGFGPFVAVYLTSQKWTPVQIGLALSIGTTAGMLSQIPGGALVDAIANKRTAAAIGILGLTASALLLALLPTQLATMAALVLQATASSVLTPAIPAISLLLVGHAVLGERLGRNARFASIGNGLAAAVMGVIGATFSTRWVFLLTAALGLPAMTAVAAIPPAAGKPRRTGAGQDSLLRGAWGILRDRRLQVFGACAVLFHLSNAAMLPLAGIEVTRRAGDLANLIIAACIVVPQIVVAVASPWVGRQSSSWGRRPVLLLGWAALPVRGLMLAFLPGPWLLVAGQAVSGISAAVFGIMVPLIAADLTRESGRFNLCLGMLGFTVTIGATLSTLIAGWIATVASAQAAFLALSAAGAAGTLLIWLAMPETRDATGTA